MTKLISLISWTLSSEAKLYYKQFVGRNQSNKLTTEICYAKMRVPRVSVRERFIMEYILWEQAAWKKTSSEDSRDMWDAWFGPRSTAIGGLNFNPPPPQPCTHPPNLTHCFRPVSWARKLILYFGMRSTTASANIKATSKPVRQVGLLCRFCWTKLICVFPI